MLEDITFSLPTAQEILATLAPNTAQMKFVESSRLQIEQILEGSDPRILLIVGPCSFHDTTALKEYAIKLQHLQKTLSETFFIAMRVYFEKPRTASGWKGFLYDPWLDGTEDIRTGIRLTRELLLELTDIGIPIASEFLTPSCANYFSDLISWGCIGARTSASPIHRQLASGLPMPIAFKNSVDGNIESAVNGATFATQPQTWIGINDAGRHAILKTNGNPHSHIVLRGSFQQTNYDPESIQHALTLLENASQLPRVIVDCSHGNASRKHEKQIEVFQSLIKQIIEGNFHIRGAILESYLFEGNQKLDNNPNKLIPGVSITDPCLSWQATEQLLTWAQNQLSEIFQDHLVSQK